MYYLIIYRKIIKHHPRKRVYTYTRIRGWWKMVVGHGKQQPLVRLVLEAQWRVVEVVVMANSNHPRKGVYAYAHVGGWWSGGRWWWVDCGGRRWCWCCQLLVLVLSLVLLLSASVAAADISVVVHVFHVASALPCLPCHCQQKKNRRIAGAPLHPLSVFPNKQRKETGGVILPPHLHQKFRGRVQPLPCLPHHRQRKKNRRIAGAR